MVWENCLATLNQEVIARYKRLLMKLGAINYERSAPDLLLPASKDEIARAVSSAAGLTLTEREPLLRALDLFDSKPRTLHLFCAQLVARPGATGLIYGVAIVVAGGASWLWIVAALLAVIGGFVVAAPMLILLDPERRFALSRKYAHFGRLKRHLLRFGLNLAGIVALACSVALWFRMVFYSGLYGLYVAILGRPDFVDLTQAFLALLMSYLFVRQFSGVLFFVANYTQLTRLRLRAFGRSYYPDI